MSAPGQNELTCPQLRLRWSTRMACGLLQLNRNESDSVSVGKRDPGGKWTDRGVSACLTEAKNGPRRGLRPLPGERALEGRGSRRLPVRSPLQ
jgi:hypothetical protein